MQSGCTAISFLPRLVGARRGLFAGGWPITCSLPRPQLRRVRKIACEALQRGTNAKRDFAHAVGLSCHDAVMLRCRPPKTPRQNILFHGCVLDRSTLSACAKSP